MRKNDSFSKHLRNLFKKEVAPKSKKKKKQSRSRDIVCKVPKPDPTPYRIPLGVSDKGDLVTLKLYENHILVCGSTGSGKSYTVNRIVQEIVKIPIEQRYIVGVDMKGGSEIAKWRECFDAIAWTYEYADLLLTNVRYEMERRTAIIRNNPRKFKTSKIKPSKDFPLIVVWIDELAVLTEKAFSKEDEEYRKHAFNQLNQLLFLGRSVGVVVVCCIQRADSKMLTGFMKNNLKTRICGRVGSSVDTMTIFGQDAVSKFPAHELTDYWFYASMDDSPPIMFKTVGEEDDADLWRTIDDRSNYPDPERGKWFYDKSDGAHIKQKDAEEDDPDEPEEKPAKKKTRAKETSKKNEKPEKKDKGSTLLTDEVATEHFGFFEDDDFDSDDGSDDDTDADKEFDEKFGWEDFDDFESDDSVTINIDDVDVHSVFGDTDDDVSYGRSNYFSGYDPFDDDDDDEYGYGDFADAPF